MTALEIPEGFTPWYGGENPAPGKMVQVIWNVGNMQRGTSRPMRAEICDWKKHPTDLGGNIIAYRVIE